LPWVASAWRSFRDQLAFSIGFAVARSRDLLRWLLKEHVTDDARQMLANRVVEHLELSGFEIDEAEQVMRKAPAEREPRLGLRSVDCRLPAPPTTYFSVCGSLAQSNLLCRLRHTPKVSVGRPIRGP
jgi:hypothetical protein